MHTANVTLDMKGLSCPGPLLGAKRMVDELEAGQILLLVSDCPGTKDDLYSWAKQTGNEVLQAQKMPDGGTGYYIQKGHGAARKANVVLDIRGVVCPGPIVEAKKLLNGMQCRGGAEARQQLSRHQIRHRRLGLCNQNGTCRNDRICSRRIRVLHSQDMISG